MDVTVMSNENLGMELNWNFSLCLYMKTDMVKRNSAILIHISVKVDHEVN
jgi:hypothetical protein